jgi:cytochrome c553
MPKHVVRLLALLFGVAVLGLVVRSLVIPERFGEFGHYRPGSVVENAAREPVRMTVAYCKECHDDRYAELAGGDHKSVSCENCHGPGNGHPKKPKKKLPIPTDTIALCTQCHEAMAGRPASQPQVDPEEHAKGEQCGGCHNPHAPKISASVKLTGDAKAGKALAADKCSNCHGDDGVSTDEESPSIAGMSQSYLVRIMTAYKSGAQADPVMTRKAKNLSDADIQNLAAYYAGLPCGGTWKSTGNRRVAAGQKLAENCVRCHGQTGIPTIKSWPSIAAQAPAYLDNALKAFRAGLRKDPLMGPAAASLSDADIASLAAFYSAQKCQPTK